MIEKKIIFFCFLIKLSQTLYVFIERSDIFKKTQSFNLREFSLSGCRSINKENFSFRGRFPNILEILDKGKISDSTNTKIKGYKYVYFPDNSTYNKYANFFPDSTIFVLSDSYKHIKIIVI